MSAEPSTEGLDFIRTIVAEDLASGKHARVVTRFPPEPNGYLHIGHAKSISLNFGLAQENPDSRCHLRFDDTNPTTEDTEYVESIQHDVRWLGYDWGEHLHFTSDYFERLFEFACDLIRQGKAFVDDRDAAAIRASQGTLTEPGTPSPFRDRSPDENLDLFERMRVGEFDEGSRVLRAKIDMASPVLTMRDPILYRIQKKPHHRTGDRWCIYPMYDFAHGLSDAIEGITHSICTMEFVDHRPLYDWLLDQLDTPSRPRQIEFAKLKLSHTIVGKRFLRRLVESGQVRGWDDPRMPTIAAMRRRGFPAQAIREFCEAAGTARRPKLVEAGNLEFHVRQVLNREAPRRMGVLRPLKLVIENYPEDGEEFLDAVNNPEDVEAGTRAVPFSRELWIERDDFLEDPPKKFFRLSPGREVRLRYAYFVTCTDVIKDDAGEVVEVRCTYDPATRGGDAPDGRKVKGTIHWVSARHAMPAEVRLYQTLIVEEEPDLAAVEADGVQSILNPESLEVLDPAWFEPALGEAPVGEPFQLERLGYFCFDPDSTPERRVANRTVTLRDSWAKLAKKGGRMKRYGMTIPMAGIPLHAHRDWFREMVDLGYTDFWSSEAGGHDGFTPLAMAAAWAPEARLGVAILPAFTRGPATLAMSAAALSEAAPGRFVLGIGASSDVIVERWNGIAFEKPYARVRDTVRFLRAALAGEKVSEEYETFSVSGFRLQMPPPDPPPKLLVAALREGMLGLAGREGDGAILNWLSAKDVEKVAPLVHAGGEGKEIVARLFVLPSEDVALARSIGRRAIAAYLTVPVYAAYHEWLGRGERLEGLWSHWKAGDRKAALEAIPDEVVDELIIHGSPEACREHVLRYQEAGVDTPALAVLHADDLRAAVRALAPA